MARNRPLLSLVRVLGVLAVFALLFVGSGYLAVRWALGGEEVQVPDLMGLPVEEAEEIVERHGLEAERDDLRLPDPEVPSDHVVRQSPLPGTPVKRQHGVRLTLSSGPPPLVLPETAGDVFTRAEIALQQHDVTVEYVARAHSAEVPESRVISQEPSSAELEPGQPAVVRLLVSMGPQPRRFVMPDLIGQPLEPVEAFLRRHGFRVGEPRRRPSQSVPPGTVVGQRPAAGYQVTEGALVELEVTG